MARKKNVWIGMTAGMIGGIAASFVMEQFQAAVKKAEAGTQAEAPPESGDPATVKAAEALVQPVLHRNLAEDEKKIAGPAMHYLMGMVSGGIYGALAERSRFAAAGFGSLFGAVVWAVADEGMLPALGLAKPAKEYPAVVHTNALAAHVVYGIPTDIVRRLLTDRLG